MLSIHDHLRLQGVLPALIVKIGDLFAAMFNQHGLALFVAQGVRTADYQHSLYLQGRDGDTRPIVTNCDGYVSKSDHQVASDGFGHAVDVAFVPTGAQHDAWAKTWPWGELGAQGVKLGMIWGGTFKKPADLDHFELPRVAPGTILATTSVTTVPGTAIAGTPVPGSQPSNYKF